ncbi:excinuclease ABC subunit A [Propionibacterium sp. oral taxon 192 str. F0372]|uniref:ATP-binding cassette domain-containing protein n=1 Tax=Propionibacterium sp. oral taxon 192 TaxID=671222 RepID=UPI0003543ADA|nr:excinuclease ABC subunit UvrA [Propionibacterium sp. oral taxon 192]EPH06184.1 excinuclease ABC subunit A [Propionibacterium sp. oral taxon 192 str. F0372]
MGLESIVLEGVSTHNLKAVRVAIPKGKLVVAAGVSGSGKSSLIVDTLFEYSKSLYLGALSSKAIDLGDGDYQADRISGVQPPVALRQRDGGYSNPRSTVGTFTGIDGLLRLMFGAGAWPVCPVCLRVTDADLLCEDCGCFAEPLSPQHFSPNRREGKCLECDGMGKMIQFSMDRIIPDRSRTLNDIWDAAPSGTFAVPNIRKAFEAMAADEGIPLNSPFENLTEKQRELVLHGSPKVYTIKVRKVTNDVRFEGILDFLDRAYRGASTARRREVLAQLLEEEVCPSCGGAKLRQESLQATLAGRSITDFQNRELVDVCADLEQLIIGDDLPVQVRDVAEAIRKQLTNICQVGLGHLQLNRTVITLSSGELQRLLLAQHLASDLTGVMYILDEPTAGLHDSETAQIIQSLRRLRDLGNTVIVIEHDEAIIRAADWIIELGPGAGVKGGEIVFEGIYADLLDCPTSVTRAALMADPIERRRINVDRGDWLEIHKICKNNVHNASVQIPLRALTCVSGVSGAGKSSLVSAIHDRLTVIAPTGSDESPTVVGGVNIEDVMYVQKRALGRSSRSSLATYIGVSEQIRDAFAAAPQAIEAGLSQAQFSTNVPGGRCEACKGLGLMEVDFSLFRSETVLCPECGGQRFQEQVLGISLDGLNIHDVLSLNLSDAHEWFRFRGQKKTAEILEVLLEFGLGYLQLGTATSTLSGGEAQRLNLARELLKQRRSGTLFIFDEPSRGLHPADIRHLLALFERLISTGNTVLAIEHNIRVIEVCDWVIDMGPGAGRSGGKVLQCSRPDSLLMNQNNKTGSFLRSSKDVVRSAMPQKSA